MAPRPQTDPVQVKKNIIANYLGTGVVILTPILALPWYLSALGARQFGLVGFVALLQTILGLLDAGLGQALVREFAVRLAGGEPGRHRAARLLFGFERIYWLFALSAGVLTILVSGPVTRYWLNLDGLPESWGTVAVLGAAVIFAVQFPGSVYRSLLTGAQEQVVLNSILSSCMLVRHLGGVVVVALWPTLPAYLGWHAATALCETVLRAKYAWGNLGIRRASLRWDAQEFGSVWRLFATMSGATLLGALTVQMDRILLSRMIAIEQFGYYSIAATVAVGSAQLISPLIQTFLPRAIQIRENALALRKMNLRLVGLVALTVGLCAVFFVLAGEAALRLWLKNDEAVRIVHPILSILLAGTALNAFYNVGYMNWICSGETRKILLVNALSLCLAVTLIPLFILSYGATGAAAGWLCINLIGLLLSLEWAKRSWPG